MADPNYRFSRLRVEGWRQFDSIDIELHERLTVITGANGAGKSTLLQLFSRHLGFNRSLLATPQIASGGAYTYLTGVFRSFLRKNLISKRDQNDDVGLLTYSNRVEARLEVPKQTGVQYSVSILNQQPVRGLHIDSQTPISNYQPVSQIPTNIISATQAYQNYSNEMHNRYNGGHSNFSPVYRMKEAIVSMATFGEGNKYVQGNREVLRAYLGFVEVLRKVLPDQIGFLDLAIRPPEIVIVTRSGEFLLDASSGGLMTLIDIAWRLYMFSLDIKEFVVTMDEPENHLHPSMQRTLMPRLLSAFPDVQFIIATHSPFMVSAVKDSYVYVLRYVNRDDEPTADQETMQRRVTSERLDTINKAGTASEVLREVLGVTATTPEWVETELNGIIKKYREMPITTIALKELRLELANRGYTELYPEAIAALTEEL